MGIKFPTRWYSHYWWAWSSIIKVLKETSLQYLYKISKMKLGMEFIFCMQIDIVSTSWHYHFWWKLHFWKTRPKYRKLLIILQYIKEKNISIALLVCCKSCSLLLVIKVSPSCQLRQSLLVYFAKIHPQANI